MEGGGSWVGGCGKEYAQCHAHCYDSALCNSYKGNYLLVVAHLQFRDKENSAGEETEGS